MIRLEVGTHNTRECDEMFISRSSLVSRQSHPLLLFSSPPHYHHTLPEWHAGWLAHEVAASVEYKGQSLLDLLVRGFFEWPHDTVERETKELLIERKMKSTKVQNPRRIILAY